MVRICTGNTPFLRSGFVALPVEAVRVVEKRRAALVAVLNILDFCGLKKNGVSGVRRSSPEMPKYPF